VLTTSAPGKTILLGEYAVLWGGPALVVAIDRRATCRFEPGEETVISAPGLGDHRPQGVSTGRPLAFIAALCDDLEVPAGRYMLDSGALYSEAGGGRQKLGLGSSAAASVAFAGAVWAARGAALDEAARERVFAQVMAAHQRVQGGGSGADVAASTYGGALRYRWLEGADSVADPGRQVLPVDGVGTAVLDSLTSVQEHILAVWTGAPADTPSFIRQVSALEADAPTDWRRWMSELSAAAEAGVGAWMAGDLGALAITAQATGATLEALGAAAGAPIVTDAHRAIMSVVHPHGAVVKPTGAGGGDLGWVIPGHIGDEVHILTRLQRAGYAAWRLPISRSGLRVDETAAG